MFNKDWRKPASKQCAASDWTADQGSRVHGGRRDGWAAAGALDTEGQAETGGLSPLLEWTRGLGEAGECFHSNKVSGGAEAAGLRTTL